MLAFAKSLMLHVFWKYLTGTSWW